MDSVVIIMHVRKYGYENERLIIVSLTIVSHRLVSSKGFRALWWLQNTTMTS